MANIIARQIDNLRGSTRFGPPATAAGTPRSAIARGTAGMPTFTPSGEAGADDTPWLSGVRKLIPGEALAGYVSLLAVTKLAHHPERVSAILADVFLVVALLTRWLGSQDPAAGKPSRTAEPVVVVLSGLSFASLVYATGGQLFWHEAVDDQQLYAQIASAAIGIVGPMVCNWLTRPGKPSR